MKEAIFSVYKEEGVVIQFDNDTQMLYVGGWFVEFMGIPFVKVPLIDFFNQLGISLKDCRKAFSAKQK